MKEEKKERKVAAIETGTVIDHIPATSTFKVLQILNVGNELVTVGNNLKSKKMGVKGVIKIADRTLSKTEINRIALIAPKASVAVIKNYEVAQKFNIEIPGEFVNVVQCFNPNCITRHQEVTTKFTTVSKDPLKLKCHYCERTMEKENISLL